MRRIVLYLAGGAMTGVFGAGVLKRLQELDLYEHLEAVYAVSAGALNGAYFLARQTEQLEQIYTQALARENFVQMARLLTRRDENVIDLDYVEQVVRELYKLDVNAFQKQPIPLYAKVLNTANDSIEYLDARDYGVFPVLQATACIQPFYKKAIQINNQSYIDGAIKESIGLEHIHARHPDATIIIVTNTPFRKGLRRLLATMSKRAVLFAACDKRLYNLFKQSDLFEEIELRQGLAAKDVFVIYPPEEFPVSYGTTNQHILRAGFDLGYSIADHAMPFIEERLVLEKKQFSFAALQQSLSPT